MFYQFWILFIASLYSNFSWSADGAQSKPSIIEQVFPFLIILGVFYFLFIRPQQKKIQKQHQFLSQIKRGDEVLTSGGMFGSIEGFNDNFVILEVSEGVKVRFLKSNISSYAKNFEKKKNP